MKVVILLGVILSLVTAINTSPNTAQYVLYCDCQSSSLIVNVIEQPRSDHITLVCTVSSADNLIRWTYLNISETITTSFMSFENGICKVSPPGSFLTDDKRYAYTCNSTVYQVTVVYSPAYSIHNHMFSCRDALQPDGTESTWIIKVIPDGGTCSYCETRMTFDVMDVNEGDNVTFVCRVSSDVPYVNWNRNFGSNTASMGVQGGQCTTTSGTTFVGNSSEYIYTCNNTVYQVTRLNAQRSEHNDMYMCTPPSQLEGQGSNWIIKVKAPVTTVTLTPSQHVVNVRENTAVEFICTTSTARPAASAYWYIHPNRNHNNITHITENITTTTDYNDLSVTTSILRFVSTRQHNNTNIFCKANDSLNANQVSSDKKLLNVLYKADDPYIHQGDEYLVIEHTHGALSCSIKGGNPTPVLSWSCNNFSPTNQPTINSNGNVTTTLTWTALRNHDGTCTCTSQQTGFHDEKIDISLVVLYPPSKPELKVNGSNVVGDIKLVEGKTRSIKCTSDSKPSPGRYTWTGPAIDNPVNKDTLIFIKVKKTDAGQYKCTVYNTMTPSDVGSVFGINNTSVNVVVLYPPVVEPIKNISKLKGEQLKLVCNFTAGLPEYTSIEWRRNIDNYRWNTSSLNIMALKKNDIGKYTCTASNNMKQSGDVASYIGQNNQSFYLDVVYEASITSFTINGFHGHVKTVNERDSVSFVCQADSNPTALITLRHGRNILNSLTSNSLEYNLINASCLQAGIYYCNTWNTYNGDNDVHATVQLFVNCYPRIQHVVDMNITSEKNETITIVLNVIAYPPPTFTWYQFVDENWTLLNNGVNYVMYSSNLQSKLTIYSVGHEDFTSYKVVSENNFGKMEQLYSLSPYDKPDPPTQFRHIEDYSTASSIHLEWNPGLDNGPSQTFYIKYKKSSDTKWNYMKVSDNGEQTMAVILTELTEDTQYHIVIFASNEKGNSSESQVLVARTQGIESTQTSGPLIGGAIGGTIGLAITVVLVVFVIKRHACSAKLIQTKRINNSSDEHTYCNVSRSVDITNQDDNDTSNIRPTRDGVNNSAEQHVYYNVGSVPVYETISRNNEEPSPYSTLDQTEGCTTSDSRGEEKKELYENLKIQVF